MRDQFVRVWDQADSPLLWVEMLYAGDVIKMKKYLGFSYKGHYFLSRNQTTRFYINKTSRAAAKKYGKLKYSSSKFIEYFVKESSKVEKKLVSLTRGLKKRILKKTRNEELSKIFSNFFDIYSSLYGFYRFCRPEFYESVVSGAKQISASMTKVGHRRFQMHQTWMRAFKQAEPLFQEIAMRIRLSSLEVKNSTSRELIGALAGGLSPKNVKKRIKVFAFYYLEKGFKISTKIPRERREILDQEITGEPAFPGKVKGKVVLVHESLLAIWNREFRDSGNKIILVTEMTSPDMAGLMKKASAFVTDEGGLLCHAAIVARELKKPCIIGTKIATKVFKDGDLVEVDANKGIVKILKRAG